MVVTAAKAHKLQAIDAVYIDYKDMEGLRRQSEEGAGWGFTGKQVIHPGQVRRGHLVTYFVLYDYLYQVDTVQTSFTPSLARREWAEQLMEAFHAHQTEGKGAFTFRGHMIDMPTVKQAQNVLDIYAVTSS